MSRFYTAVIPLRFRNIRKREFIFLRFSCVIVIFVFRSIARFCFVCAFNLARYCSGSSFCSRCCSGVCVYNNCGFEGCFGIILCYLKLCLSATAGDESIPLTQIDAPRYAAIRRTYLGSTGLTQEGAGLNFLAGWAAFYEGEDFLLAASRDGDTLRCHELLGNTSQLPGILSALGAVSGTFRVPGTEPFSMYFPLSEDPAPTYFGLAFD